MFYPEATCARIPAENDKGIAGPLRAPEYR
jgi:hypothetical protein